MSFPRIIYHLTEGIRTDYGYCYKRCETPEQFESEAKRGWKMTTQELFEPPVPAANPELAQAGDLSEKYQDPELGNASVPDDPTAAPGNDQAPAAAGADAADGDKTKKATKKTAKK